MNVGKGFAARSSGEQPVQVSLLGTPTAKTRSLNAFGRAGKLFLNHMDLSIDTLGRYLIHVGKIKISDKASPSEIKLELEFENHSGIIGDKVVLKMSSESVARLKELL